MAWPVDWSCSDWHGSLGVANGENKLVVNLAALAAQKACQGESGLQMILPALKGHLYSELADSNLPKGGCQVADYILLAWLASPGSLPHIHLEGPVQNREWKALLLIQDKVHKQPVTGNLVCDDAARQAQQEAVIADVDPAALAST